MVLKNKKSKNKYKQTDPKANITKFESLNEGKQMCGSKVQTS